MRSTKGEQMKVGDKVWLFSENRRVYPKNSKFSSGPIYAEHFYQVTIDGETSRSWLIEKTKYPKITSIINLYTNEQKADAIWREENERKIVDKIKYCTIEQLKQIDTILK
jgi:hypothetical protein